jgi:protein-S-isoprenylcysteine O-methyltransferase Ste14
MLTEVANLSIVRPPLVYLSAIALGLLLHFAWPVRLVSRAVSMPLGGTAVPVAVALFLYAVRTFRTTPVPGNRPTTTIVRTGPYRGSRNPIYLSRCSSSASPSGSTVSGSSSPSYQRWR